MDRWFCKDSDSLKSSLLGLEVESIEEEMLTSDYRNRLDA
jgi:hypothetical protein